MTTDHADFTKTKGKIDNFLLAFLMKLLVVKLCKYLGARTALIFSFTFRQFLT